MKKIIKYLAALIFLLISAVAVLLTTTGIPLDKFIPAELKIDRLKIEAPTVRLKFDGRFHLTADNVATTDTLSATTLNFKSLSCYLSNPSLLRAELSPETIVLEGVAFSIIDTGEKLTLTPNADAADKKLAEVEDSYFTILKGIRDSTDNLPTALRGLKSIDIKNSTISYLDKEYDDNYDLQINNIQFIRDDGKLTFESRLIVDRGSFKTPVNSSGTVLDEEAIISLDIKNFDLASLERYLPSDILNTISTKGNLTLKLAIDPNDDIKTLGGDIFLKRLTIREDSLSTPLDFKRVKLNGNYTAKGGLLDVNANFKMKNGLSGTVASHIEDLLSDPSIKAQVNLEPFDIALASTFVPKDLSLYEWLSKRLTGATIKNTSASLSGKISSLFEDDSTYLGADFDFENLSVDYLSTAPKGEKLFGHYNMINGDITINATDGFIKNQALKDLTVKLGRVLEDGAPIALSVKSKIAGSVKELMEIIAGISKSKAIDLSGNHSSDFALDIDLTDEIPLTALHFDVTTNLSSGKLSLGKLPIFNIPSATVTLKEDKLKATGKANINNKNLFNFTFDDSTLDMEKNLKVKADGSFNLTPYLKFIENDYLKIPALETNGSINFSMPRRNTYAINFNLKGSPESFTIPMIDFSAKKEPLSLASSVTFESNAITIRGLALKSASLDFLADGDVLIKTPEKSKIHIKNFKTNNVEIKNSHYTAGSIDLAANKLKLFETNQEKKNDTSKEKSTFDGLDSLLPKDLSLGADLRKFSYGKRAFDLLKLSMQKNGANLNRLNLSASYDNGDTITLQKNGQNSVIGKASDFGTLMKMLADSKSYEGGVLSFNAKSKTNLDLSYLEGDVKIKDVHIKDQPFILQILTFFSVKNWLSSKSGVPFSEINIKYKLDGTNLFLSEAKLDAPFISINLKDVTIDLKASTIQGSGKAVPLRSIGKLTENIPLIGNFISNTQQAIVAVPFTVKGTLDNPKVSFIF